MRQKCAWTSGNIYLSELFSVKMKRNWIAITGISEATLSISILYLPTPSPQSPPKLRGNEWNFFGRKVRRPKLSSAHLNISPLGISMAKLSTVKAHARRITLFAKNRPGQIACSAVIVSANASVRHKVIDLDTGSTTPLNPFVDTKGLPLLRRLALLLLLLTPHLPQDLESDRRNLKHPTHRQLKPLILERIHDSTLVPPYAI